MPEDSAFNAIDEYVEAKPLLQHVRIMQRVMDFVDEDARMRSFHPELFERYMAILQEELAPHALVLALVITQLEDSFPEIPQGAAKEEGSGAGAPHMRRKAV